MLRLVCRLTTLVLSCAAGTAYAQTAAAPPDPPVTIETTVTVVGSAAAGVAARVDEAYERNKSVSTIAGEDLVNVSPVANYAALRLLPGVMNSGAGGRDRFSIPTHIRGGHAWGLVEAIDAYPALNITPVSAEDGGYTAGLSSIIPSIAVRSLSVATGGLGVSYGQASGGVVRNQLKRGSAANPSSSLRVEAFSLGEGVMMADSGGGRGALDYYVAGQSSLASYGNAYETFARPIEGLRLASGLAKVGLTSAHGRLETMYVGGNERHDYFQDAMRGGQTVRSDYHTDKSNQFLAARYDWHPSTTFTLGAGATQSWFHENRIEESAGGAAVNVSRRNRPQEATRAFATLHWYRPVTDSIAYTASGGADVSWDRFEDVTTTPIAFSFNEQAGYWRNSLALGDFLTVNGGLRLATIDNGFSRDARLLYDAGAAVIMPRTHTRVFGSWSTGYKLNKAFYLWWGNGQFISRTPSAGLKPSATATLEVGAEQPLALGRRAAGTVRVAVFGGREADLFNFANTGTGVPYYDDARTHGAEAWTEWRVGVFRPFASFTWLRSYRDRTTNPTGAGVDLRFAPLPNYAFGFGSTMAVHRRLTLGLNGIHDDGGVSDQVVNDEVVVTRFGSFTRVNASAEWHASARWDLFARVENVLNRRNLGFDRTVIAADGTARRVEGAQRDPGAVTSVGLNVRF